MDFKGFFCKDGIDPLYWAFTKKFNLGSGIVFVILIFTGFFFG